MANEEGENRFGNPRSAPENFKFTGSDSVLGSTSKLPFLSEQTACLLQKVYYNLAWAEVGGTQAAADYGYDEPPRINVLYDVVPLADALLSGVADLPVGIISGLAEDIIANSIALNPHAFFSIDRSGDAGNIRGLLPIWEDKGEVCVNGICNDHFIMELECAPTANATYPVNFSSVAVTFDDLPPCEEAWIDASPSQVSDSTHFDAHLDRLADFGEKPIAADGFVGYLPYIAFQDASMHGMLELNLASMAEIYETSRKDNELAVAEGLKALDSNVNNFSPANLTELNAFLQALSANGNISGFLLR